MAKDPAFLFYPGDWIGGTMGMTFEEKGAYMEILMMQFNRGHMTSHMIGLVIGQLWDNIKDKFEVDDKGLYYNARLDLEKENRKKFTASRRNNLSGNNQYTKPIKKSGHMTSHMEDVNEDEDEDEDKKEIKIEIVIFPFNTDEFKKQWENWKIYKSKEFKFKYKSTQSEQAALKQLANLSNNNEITATEIIHQSFANGWKGFFKLKNNLPTQNNHSEANEQYERIMRDIRNESN